MLIDQIIEFELTEPWPPSRTYTPKTGYFHDKTKISQENLKVDYLLQKISYEAMYFISPHLGQTTYTI